MSPAATVYLAVNQVNGKRYVGVTRFAVERRWRQHVDRARAGIKTRLGAALRKYGAEQFTIEAVASCFSIEAASAVERAVIKQMAPEYNQTNGGEITAGRRLSPETVAKIAAANRGQKRSVEAKAKNSAQAKKRWAENREYRERALDALRAASRAVDREKQRTSAGRTAREREWSAASRDKLSASCLGRRYSAEIIEKGATARRKPILCTTTGQIFVSCADAATKIRASRSMVYRVLAGALPTVRGMHFQYLKGEVSSPTANA